MSEWRKESLTKLLCIRLYTWNETFLGKNLNIFENFKDVIFKRNNLWKIFLWNNFFFTPAGKQDPAEFPTMFHSGWSGLTIVQISQERVKARWKGIEEQIVTKAMEKQCTQAEKARQSRKSKQFSEQTCKIIYKSK